MNTIIFKLPQTTAPIHGHLFKSFWILKEGASVRVGLYHSMFIVFESFRKDVI